mgnify:CR=1 FL=1
MTGSPAASNFLTIFLVPPWVASVMTPATVYDPTATTRAVPEPEVTYDLARRVAETPSWLKLSKLTGDLSISIASPVSSPSKVLTSIPLIKIQSAGNLLPFSDLRISSQN